jgi:hypothetical protein
MAKLRGKTPRADGSEMDLERLYDWFAVPSSNLLAAAQRLNADM